MSPPGEEKSAFWVSVYILGLRFRERFLKVFDRTMEKPGGARTRRSQCQWSRVRTIETILYEKDGKNDEKTHAAREKK